jgi:hypothetical protein
MNFRFRIVDRLTVMTDLDRFQVERIAWLRLADIESHIRSVRFDIGPQLNSEFDCEYRGVWLVKLKSGRVVKSRTTGSSVGQIVLTSSDYMERKVARRVKFEATTLARLLDAAKNVILNWRLEGRSRNAAKCA